MKVESVRCIQGGMRKRWCVLDTQDVMGRECVSIGSTKQWLHTVLAGQVFGSTYYHAINNFVAECFDAAKRAKKGEAVKSVKVPPVPVQDEQNSGAASGQVVASSQAAKKGRAAIFGAAEDDSDDNLSAIVPRKQGRKGFVCGQLWDGHQSLCETSHLCALVVVGGNCWCQLARTTWIALCSTCCRETERSRG